EMTIDDLNPGTYTLLAWAGDEELGSYPRTEATVRAELQRRLQRTIADDGTHHFSTEMDRLYYGILTNAVFSTGYQDVFTVPLIKDTNNIRIVLQHLSGKEIAADDFTYTIEDTNGHLDADNALIDPTTITYHPWLVSAGTTTFGSDATATTTTTTETAEATQTTYSAAVAEFTVGRLMAENATTSRLTIRRNSDSQTIVSIPLIDALLLVKGEYRNPSTGSSMGTPLSDQEYLDRQDDYSMTFFIDENNLWMNAYIYINSWKVVLQSVGL
ncbi:MAG: FimB/Mfa2 family fimbrial subunit, partial [Bacteroidales bacterium]|nr:FimB/Mfa2 family fimbrial subunit [Bacteroidales bacterium]